MPALCREKAQEIRHFFTHAAAVAGVALFFGVFSFFGVAAAFLGAAFTFLGAALLFVTLPDFVLPRTFFSSVTAGA